MTTFTSDDIIRMAREAGMEVHDRKGQVRIGSAVLTGCDSTDQVERFAALVAAAEREACAKVCEGYGRHQITQHLAYAIRARGAEPVPTFDVSKPATDPANAPAVRHIREHLLDAARKAGAQSTTCPACRCVDANPCAVELVCTFGEGCHRKT